MNECSQRSPDMQRYEGATTSAAGGCSLSGTPMMGVHVSGRVHMRPGEVRANRDLALVRDDLAPVHATADAADLDGALEVVSGDGPIELCLRPGAIDVTACVAANAVWETVFVAAQVSGLDDRARRRTTVEPRALRGALAGSGATDIRIAPNGAMTVGEVVLTPAREEIPEPPRPDATGVLRERLTLPRSAAGIEMILRLDGPNVCIPEHVRGRFAARQVSSVSLFERDRDWYISGVRNGSPTLVLVGAVGVY